MAGSGDGEAERSPGGGTGWPAEGKRKAPTAAGRKSDPEKKFPAGSAGPGRLPGDPAGSRSRPVRNSVGKEVGGAA